MCSMGFSFKIKSIEERTREINKSIAYHTITIEHIFGFLSITEPFEYEWCCPKSTIEFIRFSISVSEKQQIAVASTERRRENV